MTPLSTNGLDLTKTEFLEFYASTLGTTDEDLAIIIDVGTVSEDAFVLDSLGFPAGVGQLDQQLTNPGRVSIQLAFPPGFICGRFGQIKRAVVHFAGAFHLIQGR